MDTKKLKGYAPTVLRAGLGLLFLLPGIDKLIGMLSGGHMLAGMISSGLTWIVLLAEIIFGVALLVGWKVKLTVWPLVIIMAVAIFMMVIPNFNLPNFMFHILAIAGLVSLYLSGEGAAAMKI